MGKKRRPFEDWCPSVHPNQLEPPLHSRQVLVCSVETSATRIEELKNTGVANQHIVTAQCRLACRSRAIGLLTVETRAKIDLHQCCCIVEGDLRT